MKVGKEGNNKTLKSESSEQKKFELAQKPQGKNSKRNTRFCSSSVCTSCHVLVRCTSCQTFVTAEKRKYYVVDYVDVVFDIMFNYCLHLLCATLGKKPAQSKKCAHKKIACV